MKRVLLVLACVAFVSACAVTPMEPERTPWKPDLAQIEEVESQLVLPEGAYELEEYYRVYAGYREGDKRFVRGLFSTIEMFNGPIILHPDGTIEHPKPMGLRIKIIDDPNEIPMGFGGKECKFVQLVWNMENRLPLRFFCDTERDGD